MRHLLLLWLGISVLLGSLIASPAFGRPTGYFESGSWIGQAFFEDGTGVFHDCAAVAEYRGGVIMLVSLRRNGGWSLGFANKTWTFETGTELPARFRIDGSDWMEAVARVIADDGFDIALPGDGHLIEAFRQGLRLELQVADRLRDIFRLTGTSALMVRLAQCVDEQIARESDGAPRPAASRDQTDDSDPQPVFLGGFNVGSWRVDAFATADGRVDSCVAGRLTSYNSHILIGIDRNGDWAIGFLRDKWGLKPGAELPTRFRIDDGDWIRGHGVVEDPNMFEIYVNKDIELIDRFRRGRTFDLTLEGVVYKFNLRDTEELVPRLEQCIAVFLEKEGPDARPDSGSAGVDEEEKSGGSTGTGIVITAQGHILTNAHVVDDCSRISTARSGDVLRPADLVAVDPINDLALLRSEGSYADDEIAGLRVGRPIPLGERVAVFGFPMAGLLSSTGNLVEGNVAAVAGLGGNINHFQISAPVQPGNSGGPLLDFSGAVIGVVNSKLDSIAWAKVSGDIPQNVNFAIKATVAATFLEAHSIDYRTATAPTQSELVIVGERARKFTVLVECRH